MYTRNNFSDYKFGKVCKQIEKKSEGIIKSNIEQGYKLLVINENGHSYNISLCLNAVLPSITSSSRMKKTVHQHLSPVHTQSLVDKAMGRAISEIPKKNKSNDYDYSIDGMLIKDDREFSVINNLCKEDTAYTISSIINLVREANPLITSILAEGVEAALYVMWGLDCGDIPAGLYYICCAVVYYWAYKQYKCIADYNTINKNNDKAYKKIVESDDTLESFLLKVFEDEKVVKFALEYLETLNKYFNIEYANYMHIKNSTELILEQIRNNDNIRNLHERKLKDLTDYEGKRVGSSKLQTSMFSKLGITDEEIIASNMALSIFIPGVIDTSTSCGTLSYIYYLYSRENRDFDKHAIDEYKAYIDLLTYYISTEEAFIYLVTLIPQYDNLLRLIRSKDARINVLASERENLESSNRELKRRNKNIAKEVRDEKAKRKLAESELTRYKNKDKLGLTPQDIDELNKKVAVIQEKLEQSDNNLHDAQRQLNKKSKEVDQLNSDMEYYKKELEAMKRVVEVQRETEESKEIHKRYNRIPIDSFISVINQYNVVIVGGDHMHSQIRERGLRSIKTISARKNIVTNEDLIGADIVVVATFCIDHSTYYAATSIAKTNNIRLLRCNNKNIDMLIYDLFEELTKADK